MQPEPDDMLPPRLGADLRALHPTPRVPERVDRLVLDRAVASFAKQSRWRRRLWWASGGAAAAAAAAAVAWIALAGLPGAHAGPRLAGDIDGNGHIDILDAFSLARQLRDAHGKPLPLTAWKDLNHDGVIDQKDVELIAEQAVHVSATQLAQSHVAATEGMQ